MTGSRQWAYALFKSSIPAEYTAEYTGVGEITRTFVGLDNTII
jgi:hypothetical protein